MFSGHSMSYAKYSSFFCDCGAENEENERGMCQALMTRVSKNEKACGKPTIHIKIGNNIDGQKCTDMIIQLVQHLEKAVESNREKKEDITSQS